MPPRLLRASDLDALNLIQTACYAPTLQEPIEVFESRRKAAQTWSWGVEDALGLCAYLYTYPVMLGYLGPLHGHYRPIQNGDTLYLHDLAIHPRARGQHLAGVLIEHALQTARTLGLRHSALIAVQDSHAFWNRQGYHIQETLNPAQQAILATYASTACYMTRTL